MAKFFNAVSLVVLIVRNLIAYTIAMFVLFGVPYLGSPQKTENKAR